MLEDIEILTKYVFDQFIPKNTALYSPLHTYRAYMGLKKVIDRINLVAEHYLALDFAEEYLQNSSFGTPADKWRYFFNKDLDSLNRSVKDYLQILYYIAPKNKTSMTESYLDNKYSAKWFEAFVRDQYSVGYVSPCNFSLKAVALKTTVGEEEYHIEKHFKIDLTTYEQRITLQNILRERKLELEKQLSLLKKYILSNYTLNDIL